MAMGEGTASHSASRLVGAYVNYVAGDSHPFVRIDQGLPGAEVTAGGVGVETVNSMQRNCRIRCFKPDFGNGRACWLES